MCIDSERKANSVKVMKAKEAPETYSIQFKDKLDEYLWKEHHFLGGCCSSIESMKYAVAREVAEKLNDAFIDKAEKFFTEKFEVEDYNDNIDIDGSPIFNYGRFIDDFRRYMKGE